MSAQAATATATAPARRREGAVGLDSGLLFAALAVIGIGLVMVASSSISVADKQMGEPFYFLIRQMIYVGISFAVCAVVLRLPLTVWERSGPFWVMVGLFLLLAVFLPGVGRTINGSTRWLVFGPIHLQVSELVKLAMIIYLAGYLVRRGEAVRTTVGGFLKPMLVIGLVVVLLLLEPDFGASAVLLATAMGMMFLGGVRLWLFGLLMTGGLGTMGLLAVTSPYRMERLTAFMNPWADPFSSGFQLTQALIAFGRGAWWGVGLGASVQKLFYLPEAHTDFLFAVLAEELGLVGAAVVIGLFTYMVWRALNIGRAALRDGRLFGGYLAYGLAIWLGLQAFINMAVNMGALPTKGLTLPLMSYGGSSMLANCVGIALLLRVDYETRAAKRSTGRRR